MRAVAIVCALVALPVLAFIGRLIWRAWHLAIVFALLASAAHARPLGLAGAGTALDPHGPGWQAMQPAPVDDPGAVADFAASNEVEKSATLVGGRKLINSSILVAQAAPQPTSTATQPVIVPVAMPVPVAATSTAPVPTVALNPPTPLVPPACVPAGKPFPVWLTVTLAIVGATVSTLEALHSTGVVGR